MSKVVNLRRARKTRERDAKRADTARKTGTDKAAVTRLETTRHEGHRLDKDDR